MATQTQINQFISEVVRLNAEYDAALSAARSRYDRASEARNSVSGLRVENGQKIASLKDSLGITNADLGVGTNARINLGIGNGFVYDPGSYDVSTMGEIGLPSLGKNESGMGVEGFLTDVVAPIAGSVVGVSPDSTPGPGGIFSGINDAFNNVNSGGPEMGDVDGQLQRAIESGLDPRVIKEIMDRYPGSYTPQQVAQVDALIEEQYGNAQPEEDVIASEPAPDPDEQQDILDEIDRILGAVTDAVLTNPNGQVPTDNTGQPTDTTGAPIVASTSTGQTDRLGNPYDPEMERVYAERNPGYPNPYSLPEDETAPTGENNDDPWWAGILGDVLSPGGTQPGSDGNGGGIFDDIGGTIGDIFSGGSTTGDGTDILAEILGRRSDENQNQGQPNPYNMSVPGFGNVNFSDGNINIANTAPISRLREESIRRTNRTLTDPRLNNIYNTALDMGNADLAGAYTAARDTLPMDQYVDQFTGRADQIFNSAQNNEMLNMLDPERNALKGAGSDQYRYANELMGQTNYDDIAQDRYDLLRTQADPYEQMQRNNLEESLYTRGGIDSKVGAMDRGALGLTQSTADIERQIQGQNLAQDIRKTNLNAASNLFQGGTNAYGTSGQLFGIGANADANKATSLGNLNYNTLRGQVSGTEAENQRRRDTLNDVKGLIGFGQDTRSNQTAQAASDYDIYSRIFDQNLDMTSTAAHPGGANRTRGNRSTSGLTESEILELLRRGMGV